MTQLLFAGVSLLFMALAIPMMARRVRPNWWYGLRTIHTLRDDRVWYEANARSGRALFVLASFLFVLAVMNVSPWVWLAVAMTGMIGVALWSMALARSLYRQMNDEDAD